MSKVNAIKQKTNFAQILARDCGGLKNSGNGYFVGYCPFCQPTKLRGKRAFWFDSKRNLANCFKPSCKNHKPMDLINYVARKNGLTNSEAIALLASDSAISEA